MMGDTLGIVAVCFSLSLVFFGMTAQVIKNHRRKSCEGLSFVLTLTVFGAYMAWGLYGLAKPDYYLLSSQGVGVVMSGILLMQFWKYRNRRKH